MAISWSRVLVVALVAAAGVVGVPDTAHAARQGADRPKERGSTSNCDLPRPTRDNYFLYYRGRRCRAESAEGQRKPDRPCLGGRYTLYYRSPACRSEANSSRRRTEHKVTLTAGQVAPRPGPDGAEGSATLMLDSERGMVCYRLASTKLTELTQAHIHRGDPGKTGPMVVDLFAARYDRDCVRAGQALLRKIQRHPADYYLDLHTADHRRGAVRGQL